MLVLPQVLRGDGESDVIMIHMYHFIELKAHSINSNSVTLVFIVALFFELVYILQRGIGKQVHIFTFDKTLRGSNFVCTPWIYEKN